MYHSFLLIEVGDNPDRERPGRSWLRNIYRVHQRLAMAFPSKARRERDPEFLQPYDPADFPETDLRADVHESRNGDAGFLFRVDHHLDAGVGYRPAILVQSARRPDWEYAFQNAGFFLRACPEVHQTDLHFEVGSRLRFRLCANPTVKREGKRHALRERADLHAWLERKAAGGGFGIESWTETDGGWLSAGKRQKAERIHLWTVTFEGILRVTDAERFADTLAAGIGPAKAFGCGLLSVAAVRA